MFAGGAQAIQEMYPQKKAPAPRQVEEDDEEAFADDEDETSQDEGVDVPEESECSPYEDVAEEDEELKDFSP
jgi:hypothetical protein